MLHQNLQIKERNVNKSILLTFAVIGTCLVGCDSRIEAVNGQMNTIRSQPPTPIEPPPTFEPVPQFQYAAQNLRSPFLPSSLYTELKIMSGKRVYPDLSRPSEPLEAYALETLMFKGSMENTQGKIIAIIQTPDGQMNRVQVGNYIGLNQGRVLKITPNKIDLIEIVSDGRDGYVERPRSLVLLGQPS